MPSLSASIESVPKISRRVIPALKRLGVHTIRDLLFHFPSRYEDFSNKKSIRDVKVNETVTLQGEIKRISIRRTAKKHMVLTEALITDGTGSIKALWFRQPFIARNLRAGNTVSLSGKIALGPDGIYLQNPAYEKLSRPNLYSRDYRGSASMLHTGGLIAIYPETEGITSRWIRYLINTFIDFRKGLDEPLPPELLRKYQFPDIKSAVSAIHFPESLEEAERAKRRFAFEELLLIQFRALRERARLKQHRAPEIPLDLELVKKFVSSLPFELTDAQRRSMWEIFQDISKPRPMNRLLEGDVGSGKTVVAAAAALLASNAGLKTAMMAPTEILARQHFDTLSQLLSPFGKKVGIRIGAEKRAPDAPVVVGTHALIQDKVQFEKLGLVVIDEQHRFGVEQRAKLIKNNKTHLVPHFLSMSATPIPRTLALTVYGDLDLSILDEMPKLRKPVITKVVEPSRRIDAYQFIRNEVKRGRQAFVICPRIEILNSKLETLNKSQIQNSKFQNVLLGADTKSVKEEHRKLSEKVFPDLRVGMLHGKLKSKEKDGVMRKFKNRELDILVSTSVVEVGVDVQNATIMMIEGAERFGLAQLHQFRGRVGRGAEQSYCFLFPSEDGMAAKRLRAVVEAKNGFELAEKDMEIRGPGDIFGTRQWGVSSEVMKALADAKLVRAVRQEAVEFLKQDPALARLPLLRKQLEKIERDVHPE